jgi:hypothetical protein
VQTYAEKLAKNREYQNGPQGRAWRKKRWAERRPRVDAIKLERGCADCGYRRAPEALDFDHRDKAGKTWNVSQLALSCAWERVLAEIAKCDVRCANCHRIKTFREGDHLT